VKRFGPERASLDGLQFDAVVIGGGINGVAIARECARAGRSTLILEQHDFGSGTTSRSTRIIHGGLRYLEHGELGLVRESLRERERLLRDCPHLVRPLNFLLALDSAGGRSALEIRFGLWLYRRFAASPTVVGGDGAGERARLEQWLDQGREWAVFSYDDAQCEFPERLVAEWLAEAVAGGAVARNYTEVLEVVRSGGRAVGVVVRDLASGQEARVSATWVINATGPWADRVCRGSRINTHRSMIGGVRGAHIVLPRFQGAPESAIYAEAVDGRPIFVVPWNGQTLVGTTEARDDGDPGTTQASEAEIEYLFDSLASLFPGAEFAWEDIRYSFAGVRPLPFVPGLQPSAITRRHILQEHAPDGAAGMISVIGGKLTTAASLARECGRMIGIHVPEPRAVAVAAAPLNGIDATLREWSRQVAGAAGISETSARALAEWHGGRALAIARLAASDEAFRQPLCPHTPHLAAEAVAAVEHECAVRLADIVLRRVPVALGACWSEECARTAARAIGTALGWTELQIAGQLEALDAERRQFLRAPHRASPARVSVLDKRAA
jgi:glycerol-3-phosphate dehydrogenase